MKITLLRYLLLSTLIILSSCGEDDPELAPIEQRVEEAIENLRDELTAPANGWLIRYRPTNNTGTFLILMDFNRNGEVIIRSDVPDNDGEFLNQTITYRIDNSLGLELILETFAVFHFLFEIDDTNFGAEFEFIYDGKVGDNLIFTSKTDLVNETVLVFEPANPSDLMLFSADIAAELNTLDSLGPLVFDANPTTQQLILNNSDVSLFWSIDIERRNIDIEFAAAGTTLDEIISNNQIRLIDIQTNFSLISGEIVLDVPVDFIVNNTRFEFTEIPFGDFQNVGPSPCQFGESNNPVFSDPTTSLGDVTIQNTLVSTSGINFTPDFYSIASDFLFDGEQNPLTAEDGLLATAFPDISFFLLVYNVQLTIPVPSYSVGVFLENGDIYMREFAPTTTDINRFQIELLDNYFFQAGTEGEAVPETAQANLELVTNELFSGGEMYAFEFPVEGLEVFRLFNPCNSIEVFLIKS